MSIVSYGNYLHSVHKMQKQENIESLLVSKSVAEIFIFKHISE